MIDGIDEADYDLLPDYLKEDSVVESPFGFEDIVLPIGFESPSIWDYSVEGIKKASLDSPPINLTKKQRKTLDNIKADLYNWGAEPSYSDIFHKQFCKKNDISLSVLKTLEKKGLIMLAKDDYYFKTDGYIIYAKPLMYAFYITEEDDFPEWFIPEAKEKGLWKADSKKINPLEKAGISGIASGATMEGLETLMAAEEDEGENANRLINKVVKDVWNHFQMNDDDTLDEYLESPPEMLYTDSTHLKYRKYIFVHSANWDVEYGHYDGDYEPGYFQPTDESNQRAIKLEEKLRAKYNTKAISINLEDSYNRNHKYGVEVSYNDETLMAAEEESTEVFKLKSYFSYLKSQKPDLAREIEFSVKNEDELPSQKIYDAGFNPSIIEEWVDYIGVEDEKLQGYESCSNCEGEGYILTSYTSATRFDPADGDGEDCGECDGTGMIDPADYMDKKGQYYAETFDDMKIKYDNRDRTFFIKSVDYDTDGEIENDELPQEFTIKIPSDYHYFDEDADEGDITDVLNEWISTETGFSTKGIVWIEEESNSWRKNAETKLSKTSCCCGADEANPCVCMKAPEPMNCSAKAPKCACYKALEKNAEYDEDGDWKGMKFIERFPMTHRNRKWSGWEYAETNGQWERDKIYIDGSNGFYWTPIIDDDGTMTEERAIAFFKSKGIPFEKLEVVYDGAYFKHPQSKCYKHDWGTPITIEGEGNRCGDVIQKCNFPLCSETKFLEPRMHEWGDFYIKDYDYEDGEFYSTQMSQECENCGKERSGHGGGKVMWDFEAETFESEYDEEDMVYCKHCSDIVGNEKEVYGDETVEYEMANGELVCLPCHKIWMDEYKNDLDPHYSPFYAESFEAEGILCRDCPMAGRHVVIRKDHTDEDGNLICPFCHSNKNFKNIPETTYLLHGGRKDDLNAETKISKICPNCEQYGRSKKDATTDYICDFCAQCKRCCETSYGCYDVAICNDCDGSFIGKDIDGCCGSCDDCCECDQDPSMNAESKSMNSYLLGAGIFALTLGLLSRKR